MIALDTNLLVRLIAGDDPAQERALLRLLAQQEAPFFIADVTLAELAWVLQEVYRFSRAELTSALEALLSRADLVFADIARLRHATRHLKDGGDFADGLILHQARAAGCTGLASFDRQLKKRAPEFILIPS